MAEPDDEPNEDAPAPGAAAEPTFGPNAGAGRPARLPDADARGSAGAGAAVATTVLVLTVVAMTGLRSEAAIVTLAIGVPLALVVIGTILAARETTRRTDAGILIGTGGVVIIGGGGCIALASVILQGL